MSATPPLPPDDPLARAEAALRRSAVPPGPPEETVARTLAALEAAGSKPPLLRRRKTMSLILKFAAAALLVAGGLAYFTGLVPTEPALAFADVAEKLRDAHTLGYTVEMRFANMQKPVTMRCLFKDPGLMRGEAANGPVTVIDITKHRTLVLDPKSKTAVLAEGTPPKDRQGATEEGAQQVIQRLRKLAEKEGKPIGKRKVGDIESQGFRVNTDGQEMTIWADPKTKQPLRVDMKVRIQDQEARYTLSGFEINPKLDDSLFSLTPPEEYKLQKFAMTVKTPEEAIIELLRTYTKLSDGTFPPRLDDWAAFDKEFRKLKFTGTTDPEYVRLIQTTVQATLFIMKHKKVYGYRSEGVKLGDKDKIVLWYKPEGAKEYRAVFGDLHVADVPAERLPKQ
jgi:outer membrane lipoprotein-sorting protein